MTKYLRVIMNDGSQWDVPCDIIAESRAKHYANAEGDYEREFGMTMGSNEELLDWAANNMNWSEVASVAIQVNKTPPPDFQEGWCNGPRRIVEK